MKFFYQTIILAIVLFIIAAKVGYSADFYRILYFMLLLASSLAIALKYKRRKETMVPNIYLKKEIILELILLLILIILSLFFSWIWPLAILFFIECSLSCYQYRQQEKKHFD